MFGMLDYRAHKLFWILFVIPRTILILITIFGIPWVNYAIGLLADNRIFQILISLVSLLIVEAIWMLVCFGFSRLFRFIFVFFVDIVPHGGRTKEEALFVVEGGEGAIRALGFNEHPNTWSEEFIRSNRKSDWVQTIFFRDKATRRLELIREEYAELPLDASFNDRDIRRILGRTQMERGWFEKLCCDADFRIMAYSYLILLFLLVYHPLG